MERQRHRGADPAGKLAGVDAGRGRHRHLGRRPQLGRAADGFPLGLSRHPIGLPRSNEAARQYGPWLTTLENDDRIAIVVSRRQVKLDAWRGIGGQYFTRLWEAFMSCLYARQPATFIFPEDNPDVGRFKALLVVGQRYEMEPALAALLAQARKQGIAILADGTCRESLVKDCTPLGVAFDHVEKLNGFNEDVAFWEFPEALLANAAAAGGETGRPHAAGRCCGSAGRARQPGRSGDACFVWVVNDTHSPLDPGLLWRVNNAIATRQPVVAQVKLPVKKGEVVYDVFAQKEVPGAEFPGIRGHFGRPAFQPRPALRGAAARDQQRRAAGALRDVKPGQPLNWTATVPGIQARLPLRAELRDGNGALVEQRCTTTGVGNIHGAGECGWAGDAERDGVGERDESLRCGCARCGRRPGQGAVPAQCSGKRLGPMVRAASPRPGGFLGRRGGAGECV